MTKSLITIKSLFAILFMAGAVLVAYPATAQTYHVKKVSPGSIRVSGKGDSEDWGRANILTDFIYPWDSVPAPATSFAALWDGEWLYCLYRVKDDSVIVPVGLHDKKEVGDYDKQVVGAYDKQDVGASDRVEIFLKSDDKMSPYYCLELDASARVLDYTASYYRKMDYGWQWPKGQLIVKSSPTRDGYMVETAISVRSLKELGLLKGGELQAGLFRAECKGIMNGRADLRWISWVKPQSAKADFHIPSAFGVLVLE